MADKVTTARALLQLRRAMRGCSDELTSVAQQLANGDAALAAVLRPHAQAFRDAVQTVVANVATDVQANAPTNAEKVQFVNSLLTPEP